MIGLNFLDTPFVESTCDYPLVVTNTPVNIITDKDCYDHFNNKKVETVMSH